MIIHLQYILGQPDQGQDILEEGYCCAKVVHGLKTDDIEVQIQLCKLAMGLAANSNYFLKHSVYYLKAIQR